MTLAQDTDRLESARLVLRRIAPDDLPFFIPRLLSTDFRKPDSYERP